MFPDKIHNLECLVHQRERLAPFSLCEPVKHDLLQAYDSSMNSVKKASDQVQMNAERNRHACCANLVPFAHATWLSNMATQKPDAEVRAALAADSRKLRLSPENQSFLR